ncbi:MAG: tRNA (adenosine(37)-N6)-threonylcarbamoyltransferase complex ATPase subunit type 1 TsaE [Clostridia bacterium]|nr:tRNA (adenosine(37)-N6)-threonylcarbamoyltransferase complex ATPase subunit type 1 TsaE [Clostridia bacterium]
MKAEAVFTITSVSPEDTEAAGKKVAALILDMMGGRDYPTVALYGDLGAGKTCFVRGMAEVLTPGAPVKSPTYTIVNEYPGNPSLFHFDMYRIESEDDLYSIGFEDYPERGISVIEWSEKIPFALPREYLRVTIDKISESERRITAEKIKN